VQAQIINLFLEIMDTGRLGLVLISHDLAVVRHLTDRVIVMRHGRIVEQGETRQVLEQPTHPYTRSLVSDLPRARAG
jgi:ABC-type oligopeptide transport system ATPase subunit